MRVDKVRVLLIEDELVCQTKEKKILEEYGFIVDVASNATKGLDLLTDRAFHPFERGYDAIFMDIMLPDINGDALTALIRQTEETAKFIPIIAVTGQKLSAEDRQLFVQVGITDIIIKPMTKETLDSVLVKYKRI